jgi:hypothetical protein
MDNYYLFTSRYLDLLEKFMFYMTNYKTNFELPNRSNIVFFDDNDRDFSNYSLKVLNRLKDRKETNIIEVTRTGSKTRPWRVASTL